MYGSRLKNARKNAGYTLEQVAEKLNTTHASISRYENEKRKIDPQTLIEFCKLYKVSSDYILGLPENLPYPKYK